VSQALECAKLRGDLVVSQQEAAGAVALVVKDPVAGRFFRFGEVEGFILQQLDGATSSEQVRARVKARFGAALPPEQLEQFTGRVRTCGLLEEEGAAPRSSQNRRVRGDLFYLRLKAFDPDRLLDRLVGKLGFFFTPQFLLLSSATLLLAFAITAANWTAISREFPRLLRFNSLLLAWVVVFLIITCHEFAHGLTCKYYGGRVREMGFLLLYFQPAFYCNVSDAWLFPQKASRLWVTFAGAYFEIFLWALATLTWRVSAPHTVIHFLALVVMVTSGVKTLFNLNPLIKLDGYYLLSDLLEIPNLRGKAFAYLQGWLRGWRGGVAQQRAAVAPREQRIYLAYGLLAGVYSYWFLGLVASRFGSYLVERYQGWGAVLFCFLLGGLFRGSLKKMLKRLSSSFALGRFRGKVGEGVSVGRVMPTNTAPPRSASSQTQPGRGFRSPVKFLGVGLLLAALFLVRMELKVGGEFTVLPAHNADIRAEVEGLIEEICASQGDTVAVGAPIARLSSRDCRAELQKVKAQVDEQEARLKLLRAGPRPEEVELARVLVAKAEDQLQYAEKSLGRSRVLLAQQHISQKDFEEAEVLWAVRRREMEEARYRLEVLVAGSRAEELEAVEAEVHRLGVQQRYLEEQLRSLTLVSPIAGIVTTPHLEEKVGQYVGRGELIAEVHELQKVKAEIAVPEREIADVRPGQEVVLKARAYPQRRFQGQVMAIAPIAAPPDEWREERWVLVTTQLDNAGLLLKPEMSGNAKVHCGERRLIELVSRRFIRFVRVEFWSWW
jgi:multidrug resistance efflux pump